MACRLPFSRWGLRLALWNDGRGSLAEFYLYSELADFLFLKFPMVIITIATANEGPLWTRLHIYLFLLSS